MVYVHKEIHSQWGHIIVVISDLFPSYVLLLFNVHFQVHMKISDFGLARVLDPNAEYYKSDNTKVIPAPWLVVEQCVCVRESREISGCVRESSVCVRGRAVCVCTRESVCVYERAERSVCVYEKAVCVYEGEQCVCV